MIDSLDFNIAVSFGIILFSTLIFCIISILIIFQRKILNEKEKKHDLELSLQKKLTSKLVNVQHQERKQIARDLHDECGALILGIKASIESSLDELGVEHLPGKSEYLLNDLSNKIRTITHNLYPSSFKYGNLDSALIEIASRYHDNSDIELDIHVESDVVIDEINKDDQLTLYHIICEWLNNAQIHGIAKNIKIELMSKGNGIQLKISDDGSCFDFEKSVSNSTGLGLRGIIDRLDHINSSFRYFQNSKGLNVFEITHFNKFIDG